MKVVDRARIVGQQSLQKIMGRIRRHLLADEAKAYRHSMHVSIHRRSHLATIG